MDSDTPKLKPVDARYDYCKLFIRGPIARASLQSAIAAALKGRLFPFYSVDAESVLVDVRKNDDYDGAQPERFTFWPVYADITRKESASDNAVRDAVATVMTSLWSGDIDVVAACKFEDELPRKGGRA